MAALMCFAFMPTTAFAEGESDSQTYPGSITIDNALDGYTYTAYRVLDLESYDVAKDAYSYTVAEGWTEFIDAQITKGYVEKNDNGYVSWVGSETDAAQFAKDAVEYAKANEITGSVAVAENSSVTMNNLPLGYYAVDSSVGALCSLNTTNPEAAIQEKNDLPSLEKQVREDDPEEGEDGWGDNNDASIGQVIDFQILVTGVAGTQNLILHDKMDAPLTLDPDSINVSYNDTGVALTEGWSKLVPSDDCTFEIKFDDSLFAGLVRENNDYLTLKVTYTATINEYAVIGEGIPNKAQLEFGDSNKTDWDVTITNTWGMSVEKVDGRNTNTKLAGAVFALTDANGAAVNVVPVSNADPNAEEAAYYRVCTAEQATQKNEAGEPMYSNVIKTNLSGKFYIDGLDSGKYYLDEQEAPAGYNKITDPIEITVNASGANGYGYEGQVENLTGSILPSTGGVGTVVLYVVGAAIVLIAIVALVRRRSKSSK